MIQQQKKWSWIKKGNGTKRKKTPTKKSIDKFDFRRESYQDGNRIKGSRIREGGVRTYLKITEYFKYLKTSLWRFGGGAKWLA